MNGSNENSWKKDLLIRYCFLGRLNAERGDPCPRSTVAHVTLGAQNDGFCHGQDETSLSHVAILLKIFCTVFVCDNLMMMEEDSILKC